jgi:tRNA (Thr-GGU) A37 N-methylase
MEIKLIPIAVVKNSRTIPTDDYWEEVISEIELVDHIPTVAFERISDFSHLEIIYFFNKADNKEIVYS